MTLVYRADSRHKVCRTNESVEEENHTAGFGCLRGRVEIKLEALVRTNCLGLLSTRHMLINATKKNAFDRDSVLVSA
jgi:hypothetical protein